MVGFSFSNGNDLSACNGNSVMEDRTVSFGQGGRIRWYLRNTVWNS